MRWWYGYHGGVPLGGVDVGLGVYGSGAGAEPVWGRIKARAAPATQLRPHLGIIHRPVAGRGLTQVELPDLSFPPPCQRPGPRWGFSFAYTQPSLVRHSVLLYSSAHANQDQGSAERVHGPCCQRSEQTAVRGDAQDSAQGVA